MKLTPEQEAAVHSRARLIAVSAAAGSGKTRVLVERIISLLEDGQHRTDLDRIVAITFTEKAAGEMRDRLRAAFRARAAQGERDEMNLWRRRERLLENARIQTIHSFCTNLLKENALHIGLDPDFSVLDDAEGFLSLKNMLEEMLHKGLEDSDPHATHLCTVYGFSNARRKLQDLLNKRNALSEVLNTSSFTCADDVMRDVERKLVQERNRIHEAAKANPATRRWLRYFEGYAGACSNPENGWEKVRVLAIDLLRALREGASQEVVESKIAALQGQAARGGKPTDWNDPECLEKLKSDIKRFRDKNSSWITKNFPSFQSVPEFEQNSAATTFSTLELCRRALHLQEQEMDAKGRLDFDALVHRSLECLQRDAQLRRRVASRFDHLLIDEFQDTDRQQLGIIEAISGEDGGPSVFVVGDVKQSIYNFRGADVEVFNQVRRDAEEDLRLTENFRTVPEIVAFVNDFFEASGLLAAVEPEFIPMLPNRPAASTPCVELLLGKGVDNKEERDLAEVRVLEAQSIASRIRGMVSQNAAQLVFDADMKCFRNPRYADIVLLFRTSSNVHVYESALRQAGVPYVLVSGGGFYERQEVLDILNVLKLLLDPYNEMCLLAFLRSPMAALNDDSIFWLTRDAPLCVAFNAEVLPHNLRQVEELERARALLKKLSGMRDEPVSETLHTILCETQYEAALLSQLHGVQRLSNIRKLMNLAQASGDALGLRDFVQYLDEARSATVREAEAPLLPEGADAVTLMTIHKSKGLEYPVVILPDMAQDKFGGKDSGVHLHRHIGLALSEEDDEGTSCKGLAAQMITTRQRSEEEAQSARALYVAMTRAKDYLILSGHDKAADNSWFGQLMDVWGIEEGQEDGMLAREAVQLRVCRAEQVPTVAPASKVEPTSNEVSSVFQDMSAALPPVSPKLRHISVTQLLQQMFEDEEGEDKAGQEENKTGLSPRAKAAMRRGTLLHRIFELYDFKSGLTPNLDPILDELNWPYAEREAIKSETNQLLEQFRKLPIAKELAAYGAIMREMPFQFLIDGVLVSGTIDALIAGEMLLDYKSGTSGAAKQERYETQLLLYAGALRLIQGSTPKRAALYFMDEGKVEEVTLSADRIDVALAKAEAVISRLKHETSI